MKSFFLTLKRAKLRYSTIILPYIFVSLIASVGLVVMNLLSGEMSNAALQGDVDALFRFIGLITAVLVLRAGASAASTIILARFSAKASYKLREVFVNHFLRVPFSKIEKTPSGEHLSIYSNDIPLAEGLVASGILGIMADFISFTSAFIFLIIISPAFTGILLLAGVGMLGLQILLSMPIQKWGVKLSVEQAKFNAIVNDSLQNLSVVAAYSLDSVLEERYMNAYRKYFSVRKSFAKALALAVGSMIAVLFSPLIVVVIVLAMATIDGNMTLVEFIAFSTTIMIAAGGLTAMAQTVSRLAEAAAGAKRLNDNTADATEELENGNAAENGVISFKNVTFSYGQPTGDEEQLPATVLDDINFDIAPGSKVAIVGGSGSGKSTIIKLMLGLYQPASGQISINGRDTTQLAKGSLRDIFSYVPQDSFLFPESIGKNITLEDEITNMPQLEKACTDADILGFINTLPGRFDSVLTESAENISGGQRQRIAMARAFYKNAPVILFDEATSSLDPATEATILERLAAVAKDKTVIIVAHRESAITACDTIITLDGGKIKSIESKGV